MLVLTFVEVYLKKNQSLIPEDLKENAEEEVLADAAVLECNPANPLEENPINKEALENARKARKAVVAMWYV